MRARMSVVAVFLVYLMAPGSAELTETVVHLATHGDTAHADADGHADSDPADEHGCSGGYHLCVCHHATGFLMPAAAGGKAPSPLLIASTPPPPSSSPGDVVDSIFRPPIA